MSASTAAPATTPRKKLSTGAKRGIWIGVIALIVLGVVLGTKVVSNDDASLQGAQEFDPATFGAENFPQIQEAVAERATDAATLAEAIAADPAAAAEEYAVASSNPRTYRSHFSTAPGMLRWSRVSGLVSTGKSRTNVGAYRPSPTWCSHSSSTSLP